MITSLHVGGYSKKESLSQVVRRYSLPLTMTSIVHDHGARKYACYSWYNDPDHGNSSVIENIDAILRHFSAYSMGWLIDIEGLPHIFHMCCRASMLVTINTKKRLGLDVNLGDCREFLDSDNTFWYHLTPYIIKSLSIPSEKYDKIGRSATVEQLIPILSELLIRASVTITEEPGVDENLNLNDETLTLLDEICRVVYILAIEDMRVRSELYKSQLLDTEQALLLKVEPGIFGEKLLSIDTDNYIAEIR